MSRAQAGKVWVNVQQCKADLIGLLEAPEILESTGHAVMDLDAWLLLQLGSLCPHPYQPHTLASSKSSVPLLSPASVQPHGEFCTLSHDEQSMTCNEGLPSSEQQQETMACVRGNRLDVRVLLIGALRSLHVVGV